MAETSQDNIAEIKRKLAEIRLQLDFLHGLTATDNPEHNDEFSIDNSKVIALLEEIGSALEKLNS